VDWYDAYADLSGERTKLQVFSMRSMASGAAFHCAYLHSTQQAFLEAHELAFAYFSGVFRKLRYDNLTSAVKGFRGGCPFLHRLHACDSGGMGGRCSNQLEELEAGGSDLRRLSGESRH
jgi:hypothetical protein